MAYKVLEPVRVKFSIILKHGVVDDFYGENPKIENMNKKI